MKKTYCCRCKKESWEEGYCLVLLEESEEAETFDEAVQESFSLCESCRDEFVNGFMKKSEEKPHRIVTEEDLLTKAAREDVREYMKECGVEEDMALFISERVRKGLVGGEGWRKDMLDAMHVASVPAWFVEACKKISYMYRRDNYRPPILVDTKKATVSIQGISILSVEEFEKNKDLIRVRKPFWCLVNESQNHQGRCGVIIGPDIGGLRVYEREWGSVYPVLILGHSYQLTPGSKLIYAGERFTVLHDGLALCDSEYIRMKLPLFNTQTYEETYLSKALSKWFRDNGSFAIVLDR